MARAAGGALPPTPIGLFTDGVPFQKRGSLVAVWFFNLVTGVRHIAVVFKKEHFCSCGCRGWCTLFAVFDYLRWAFEAAAQKVFPARRHDDAEWPVGDRSDVAGTSMQHRFALIWSKADWLEIAVSFGFPTWSSARFPCFGCNAEHSEMAIVHPASVDDGLPWMPLSQADYNSAAGRCQIDVVVPDRATLARLRAALRFDRSRDGARGRALVVDVVVGDVRLLVGDRLEPSTFLRDTFAIDRVDDFPKQPRFWRTRNQGMALHYNPLFLVTGSTSLS